MRATENSPVHDHCVQRGLTVLIGAATIADRSIAPFAFTDATTIHDGVNGSIFEGAHRRPSWSTRDSERNSAESLVLLPYLVPWHW
jgi:hypothetical protein